MRLLTRIIPPFLVRFFARPYVAGDSLEAAMDAVVRLWEQRGLLSTLDLLAEDIETEAAARANLETYLKMVEAVATHPRLQDLRSKPSLSLKLSSYTTRPLHEGGDAAGTVEAVREICVRARDKGVPLTLDMEGSPWTDFTLDFFRELHADGFRDVGCVLQSRLHRAEADAALLPDGCRVRLVIGIYQEDQSIALVDKPAMKKRLLTLATDLLRRGHYVEFGTHDQEYVRRFVDEVVPECDVGPDRFEVQMLYGVPRERLLAELRDRGITCRLYVPFALGWDQAVHYLRRRLDEFPAMMWLVARNMVWRR